MPAVVLPDRVTVLSCIGCGAMGRQERCEGACSEHKLELVEAAAYDALMGVATRMRELSEPLAAVARRLVAADSAREALADTREPARRTLRERPRSEAPAEELVSADSVTGWWCAQCGNVDLPQPCIGVCVWRPSDWVNRELYEQQLRRADDCRRAADRLVALLRRLATVTPRPGQWERNWQALRAEACDALDVLGPQLPPEVTSDRPPAPEAWTVRLGAWPR
jgi:hypothetical protein